MEVLRARRVQELIRGPEEMDYRISNFGRVLRKRLVGVRRSGFGVLGLRLIMAVVQQLCQPVPVASC